MEHQNVTYKLILEWNGIDYDSEFTEIPDLNIEDLPF